MWKKYSIEYKAGGKSGKNYSSTIFTRNTNFNLYLDSRKSRQQNFSAHGSAWKMIDVDGSYQNREEDDSSDDESFEFKISIEKK